jgi:hypothetical protein
MQNQKIGTRMMSAITAWLDANAPVNAIAVLITGEGLKTFYQHFDFQATTGMIRNIQRNS